MNFEPLTSNRYCRLQGSLTDSLIPKHHLYILYRFPLYNAQPGKHRYLILLIHDQFMSIFNNHEATNYIQISKMPALRGKQ